MGTALTEAILNGDVDALRGLIEADPLLLRAPTSLGDGSANAVPPLHLVCDAVFRGLVDEASALAMADVLLEAGVEPNESYAKSGDTYLIAAASLGAERVGLRLVERGADVHPRGLFGATALHWAGLMGLERLAGALVDAGSELELRDTHYDCTPLDWVLHAWIEGTNGRRDGLPRVAARLVAAGAGVPATASRELRGPEHRVLRAALGLADDA